MRVLFILILISFSCSFYPPKDFKRFPASSRTDRLSRLLSYGLDHIKDYKPQSDHIYHFDQWHDNPQESYEKLGMIERHKVKGIPAFIVSRKYEFRTYYKSLSLAKQLSFAKWESLSVLILESFESGHHVFKYEGKLYTLFGVELSENNIEANLNLRMNRLSDKISKLDLMWHFFNGYDYVKLDDRVFLELPQVKRVSQDFLRRVRRDAITQVPDLNNAKLESLLNYRHLGGATLFDDKWRNFFASREKSYRRGSKMRDSEIACSTRLYLRALSEEPIALKFSQALLDEKSELMRELDLTNNEYNELMTIAMGVLLVETKMGNSIKYVLKEGFQFGSFNLGQYAIRLAKRMKGRSDNNSRGLTQIKNLGPLVKNTSYEYLEGANLNDPKVAAIGTMFVLREKLGFLRHFQQRHSHINSYNWADYLYYFYQGSSAQVVEGRATPKLNLRVRNILLLRNVLMLLDKCD